MQVAPRIRLVLARRPWIYWVVVAALAAVVAFSVAGRLADVDASRREWGDVRTVLVADGPLEPGDAVRARPVELPTAALPDIALDEASDLPAATRVRQRIADGEVLTALDIATGVGPAAGAASGSVVVAVSDPLTRAVVVGSRVRVAADGLVLAEEAEVVDVVDDVLFVAVDDRDGPMVAAAARQGIVSLLLLP